MTADLPILAGLGQHTGRGALDAANSHGQHWDGLRRGVAWQELTHVG